MEHVKTSSNVIPTVKEQLNKFIDALTIEKDKPLDAKHTMKRSPSLETSDEAMLKEVQKIAKEPIGTKEQPIKKCIDPDVTKHAQLTMNEQEPIIIGQKRIKHMEIKCF